MLPGWGSELARLSLLFAVSGIVGLTTGYLAPVLLAGSLLYAIRLLWQMHRFQRWLAIDSVAAPPPVGTAVWGEIFERIYTLLRRGRDEHHRLQQSVSYFQESFSAINDGVVMLNSMHAIQWCNTAAERLLGLKLPGDAGQTLANLVRDPAFTRYLAGIDNSVTAVKIASPINDSLQLEIQIAVFGEQNRIVFVRDITALQHLETVRQDFVANISHEMRTPLTVIRGYLETMEEVVAELGPPWPRGLAQMHEQTTRMEVLLRDLLLLSTLESMATNRELAEEEIELRPMLESLWENALRAANGQREVVLVCDPALRMLGDRLQLESIFSNLIFNAVKYTEAGGKINISFEVDETNGVFSVEDDGIGIDSVHIPRLTERFYRVDKSRSVERGGTGLGLAIVKHALRYYMADLQIRSEPGKGSVFRCSFPGNRFIFAQEKKKNVM